MNSINKKWNRRQFIGAAGSVAAMGVAGAAPVGVSLVIDPSDNVANSASAQWAAKEFEHSLIGRGIAVLRAKTLTEARPSDVCVLIAGSNTTVSREILKAAGEEIADVPEALGLVPGIRENRKVLLAAGRDSSGLIYALLDLADRVNHHASPFAALTIPKALTERPANPVRGVSRLFTSDVEDKPWFQDREMWPRYLTMLAAQRFNRFHLALGIGYDFIRHVTDGYFLFSYPFLLNVPGYNVRVPQLSDAERDHNLELLRFISEETVARGMRFQIGLWMHGYEWIDSPNPNYTIEGLSRTTHGPYCRDAVRMLLKACPAIGGVTFRVHGESGVEEGSYEFWKTVFEGVATCGRKVEIDMHAKGIDQTMLDLAVATHQPVRVSPKFWAEHLGMTYHQADIRQLEKPRENSTGLMKFSAGSRNFLRYGYGDLLREDRPWSVIHRIWPGTQRLLLWGDPQTAAAYSRAFSFCGSDGVDICEPLSFKGRRGSGIAGDRCGYADASLRPRWDWEKYVYGHRVWGRLLYNPDTESEVWRRYLRDQFGPGGEDMEVALANASRILPVVTTGHAASAGNNTYWPEVYLNQSLMDASHPGPYTDSPAPKVFGNVSPLDPQLFSRINDFADELLKGERTGQYSPIKVAQWIEDYAATALASLAKAQSRATGRNKPEYRRAAIDIEIQAGLGRFFGSKFRAGVLFRIHEQTGDRAALEACLNQYRRARSAWATLAARATGVYMRDITVGEVPQLRGHWADRLPAIDQDIARLAEKLANAKGPWNELNVSRAIKEALGRPARWMVTCSHVAPLVFRAAQPLEIKLSMEKTASSVKLFYRHVNQAENYQVVVMNPSASEFSATIPGTYTDTMYPLEYYFEIRESPEQVSLHPGFSKELTNQPYFVVRRV